MVTVVTVWLKHWPLLLWLQVAMVTMVTRREAWWYPSVDRAI